MDLLLREPALAPSTSEEWLTALQRQGVRPIVHERCPEGERLAAELGLPLHQRASSARAPVDARVTSFSRSCHSVAECQAAQRGGAAFVLLSPAFSPTSKPLDERPTLGVEGLAAAQAQVGIPVLALGGITPRRAAQIRAAGGQGVAVLGDVWSDAAPRLRLLALLKAAS